MPKLLAYTGHLPHRVGVAVSGGVDSMVILHFLMQSKRDITVYHVNHGTAHATHAEEFVSEWCAKHNLPMFVYTITEQRGPRQSAEEFWRTERYGFFHSQQMPIITGHHLDDCVETWLFTCFNGNPKIIPYNNQNVIRPFRLTTKANMLAYAQRKGVPFVQDQSNFDNKYNRNRIRNLILPEVLNVNPGIHKVIRKKINNENNSHQEN